MSTATPINLSLFIVKFSRTSTSCGVLLSAGQQKNTLPTNLHIFVLRIKGVVETRVKAIS